MSKIKVCPISSDSSDVNGPVICSENHCAWWVEPYTTEGLPAGGMCAIKMLAMKTNEGQYRV